MDYKGISEFLTEHEKKNPVWFHMPGHKGEVIYRENGYGSFLDKIMNCDITEIKGADNLFQPESIIRETMNRYKAIYDTKESYLLVNGSSAGLIAAIMAAVKRNGKLIMARNCHKSVFNGLTLAGAEPVYVYPEILDGFDITGKIKPEEVRKTVEENPDADAVLITSPNYYGICSDIKSIADIAHKAGMVLIVDQAHGAHLALFDKYVSDRKKAAENLGADIVIDSTHKTLASFTQSAVANICTDRIDKYVFEDKLQMVESTSPSYLLTASLDINADLIEKKGKGLVEQWNGNLEYFYAEADKIPGMRVIKDSMLDRTKLNLDMSAYGIDGLELEQMLMKENIYVELVTGNILMCMTGIGNKRNDYERLIAALGKIAGSHSQADRKGTRGKQLLTAKKLKQNPIPEAKKKILLKDAAGRTAASSIIPYPPGSPIVCPGEVFDEETVDYLIMMRSKGEKVMGIDDRGMVNVGNK